jgi:hypothetical protein
MTRDHYFLNYKTTMYVSSIDDRLRYVGIDRSAELKWDIKQGFMVVTMKILRTMPNVVGTNGVTVSQERDKVQVFTNRGYSQIQEAMQAIVSGCKLADNLCLQSSKYIDTNGAILIEKSGGQVGGEIYSQDKIAQRTVAVTDSFTNILSQYTGTTKAGNSSKVWVLDPNVKYEGIIFDGTVAGNGASINGDVVVEEFVGRSVKSYS